MLFRSQEIERKFLLAHDGWRQSAASSTEMLQGYLANDASCTVRVRLAGDQAWLTIKGATSGVSRDEYEYSIPPADAREMLARLARTPCIEKVRFRVPVGDHVFEIDEFRGDNAGLIVAEVELAAADERFPRPDWLGDEVSDDPRYMNAALAERPYKDW